MAVVTCPHCGEGFDPSRWALKGELHAGPYRVDLSSNQVWRGEEKLDLPPRPRQVLVALIRAKGGWMRWPMLAAAMEWTSEHNLRFTIRVLRKRIGKDAIEGRRWRGYRLVLGS